MNTTGRPRSGSRAALRASIALIVFVAAGFGLFMADAQNRYLWVKALHVIAVISWMAGLLYMPRLFIYHLDQTVGSEASETFKVMERRLLTIIMTPAMVLSWIFGLWMAIEIFHFQGLWLHLKLLAVMGLTGTHVYMAHAVNRFGSDQRIGTSRSWRLFNEAPTVLMIVIVILVIVKPFG
ncbi:protoporphyrinogen oxidase HemJ [Rhizobium sp. C1]|uniref:protoporphyrinogen oxidase HemJ n=1 Tax=Rhizobium sp. C1 TaxID=1349799 RepID=UPI001E403834|nr:protoporphyrinogen oxidase HemJ [Rhizobium sp. C1]MCD2178504.1 protoporphyrinogen oxidase HemJ [Rhizobium sp. C1]